MSLLHIYKLIKLWHKRSVFSQHNPKQKNHESIFHTSLMEHAQGFEDLWIKYVWFNAWSFDFIFIVTQMT